jgi:hypothetical protein
VEAGPCGTPGKTDPGEKHPQTSLCQAEKSWLADRARGVNWPFTPDTPERLSWISVLRRMGFATIKENLPHSLRWSRNFLRISSFDVAAMPVIGTDKCSCYEAQRPKNDESGLHAL